MSSEPKTYKIAEIAEKIAMGPFGSNIKVETFVEHGIPIISGMHLRGMKVEDLAYNYITTEHAERLKNSIVKPGDIIFTHAGNVGQVAMVPYDSRFQRYIISQRQFYLRLDKSKALPEYVTYFFHTREGRGKLLANVNPTGVPSLSQPSSYLKTIEINLPSIEMQKQVVKIVESIENKISIGKQLDGYLAA